MLLSSPPVALLVFVASVSAPVAVLLALIPGAIVVGAFVWLDRVEPEPRSERVHAFLWGATFAALAASAVNGLVASLAGTPWALVVSAPIGEEVLKALGIVVAVRRRRLRSWFDGVVYAGFVAAGFALVENAMYFLEAASRGDLATVFVLRGLATPFAHPLFSMFSGMFIGRFAASRAAYAYLGLPVAVGLHAAWNAASLAGSVYAAVMLVSAFVLFWGVLTSLVLVRLRATRVYRELVPVLAFRYHFDPFELSVLATWEAVVSARRTLPRSRRERFEELHTAVLSLAAHIRRGEGYAGEVPDEIATALLRARSAFSDRRLPPPR